MLKLNLSTENARELAYLAFEDHHAELSDSDFEEVGNAWIGGALRDMTAAGIDYQRVYRQSVGAFAIVQDGTPGERTAWESALNRRAAEATAALNRRAKARP